MAKHSSPDDDKVVLHLIMTMFTDVESTTAAQESQAIAERDKTTTDIAKLITRIAEQDCNLEVKALAADKPPGGAFTVLFQMLMARLTTTLRQQGFVFGIDIMKKLGPTVLQDLGVFNATSTLPRSAAAGPPSAAASSTDSTHLNRIALSGVRLQLEFDTALNPDCSVTGDTVIRIVKLPEHGTATADRGKGFSQFPSTDQRYRCNEQRTPGAVLYYQSARGYRGPDSLSYQVIDPNGTEHERTIELNVE